MFACYAIWLEELVKRWILWLCFYDPDPSYAYGD
jgi:hypothetical protein